MNKTEVNNRYEIQGDGEEGHSILVYQNELKRIVIDVKDEKTPFSIITVLKEGNYGEALSLTNLENFKIKLVERITTTREEVKE